MRSLCQEQEKFKDSNMHWKQSNGALKSSEKSWLWFQSCDCESNGAKIVKAMKIIIVNTIMSQ